jgi:D-alanyl-D-alanine carboxypeptidase
MLDLGRAFGRTEGRTVGVQVVGRFRIALLATIVGGVMVAAPTASAQAGSSPPTGSLRADVNRLVTLPEGPPGAVVIVQNGTHQTVLTAGVSEVGAPGLPAPSDHMRLASFSKAYSGAVALALTDRGELSLSDTIGARLPWLPRTWWPVTLRELLNHTSGLPDFSASQGFRTRIGQFPHVPLTPEQLLGFVTGKDLEFTPGTQFKYDNSDNIVAALMSEAATGQSYDTLLHELVFAPLGLERTSLPEGFTLPDPFMHGYALKPGTAPEDVTTIFSASLSWASGGMVSTPFEVNRFIRAYSGGALFSAKTQAKQLRFVAGSSQPPGPGVNSAGLAIFRYRTPCGTVYGHTGNYPGYTQFAAATLDGTRSVTVSITTQVPGLPSAVFDQLLRVESNAVCAALA